MKEWLTPIKNDFHNSLLGLGCYYDKNATWGGSNSNQSLDESMMVLTSSLAIGPSVPLSYLVQPSPSATNYESASLGNNPPFASEEPKLPPLFLPIEIIQMIIQCLPLKEAFRVATGLRFKFLQKQTMHAMCELAACKVGRKRSKKDLARNASTSQHVRVNSKSAKGKNMWIKCAPTMDNASRRGQVDLLQWWVESSSAKLNYTTAAINYACRRGHIHVLDWWVVSGLQLKYTKHALTWAYKYEQPKVLEWWKSSALKLPIEMPREHLEHQILLLNSKLFDVVGQDPNTTTESESLNNDHATTQVVAKPRRISIVSVLPQLSGIFTRSN